MKPAALMLFSLAALMAQTHASGKSHATTAAMPAHVLITPDAIQWMAARATSGLPSVVQMAVLAGDPSQTGQFVVRLKIPAGSKIAAHWHPTDENVTVLQGTFAAGMGDKFAEAELHEFPVGSYILMPRTMHHFAMAKDDVVIQIAAQGPFAVNYVDPADDPRKK